jgi:methyl-accepting chemotaxis protein WspA
MGRLGFRGKLFGLIGLFLVSFVAVEVLQQFALHTVKVEGPLYQQITREDDLINEVTPPTLYIREPFLLLHKVCLEQDPARMRDWIELYRKSERDYHKAYEHWLRELPDGPIKDALRDEMHAPAVEFFDLANREFLPLADGGPANTPKLIPVLRERLRPIYQRQGRGAAHVGEMAAASTRRVEESARETVQLWNAVTLAVGGLSLAAILAVGWWITRGIVNPTRELIDRMRDMAEGAGDLTARIDVPSQDEVGELAAAINAVVGTIHDLVVKVRESSIQLYASSTEIAATSREQEATMQNLGASTNQIAAAVKQITATSQELSSTMNAVNDGGKQTVALAGAGRAGLGGMKAAMQRLADSTGSIAGKLSVVREKANDINVVVTTITKVADQTNLLSINAAIEAEKAGEYGRGFLVVAREIRRLADQTAVATLDIENMVRQMQGAVSAGVMEMDKFTEEVRSGVARVGEINAQMGQIIEQVHALNDRFQSVTEGTAQQSAGARQINDAMLSLAAGVSQTSASLKEFHSVTVNLRESADALKQQVARFTVKG